MTLRRDIAFDLAPSGVQLQYAFDGQLQTGQTWSGPVSGSVTRTYNNDFRIASERVNGGAPANFQYDADGLLIAAGALGIQRAATTGSLSTTQIGSVSTAVTYNTLGEPASYGASFGGSSVFQVVVTRDAGGRVTRRIETVSGVSTTRDFTYDPAGHVATVTENGVLVASYEYDPNGNRTRTVTPNGASVSSYDARDRLVTAGEASYTYSLAGDLTGKTVGGGTTTYEYDPIGNLLSVMLPSGRRITYVMDGENRRLGRKVDGVLTQGYLYGTGSAIAAELDGQGAVVSTFVYGARPNVPDYMIHNGATYRLVSDMSGSVRLVIDVATGEVAQRLDYDAYGRVTADTRPGFQPFGYNGKACMTWKRVS